MNRGFRIATARVALPIVLAVASIIPLAANHDVGREGFPIAVANNGSVKDVAKAPSGNVYVLVEYQDPLTFAFPTGDTETFTPTGIDLAVIKYDSRAQPVWVRSVTNSNTVRGGQLGIDSGENIYFVGTASRSDAVFGSIPIVQSPVSFTNYIRSVAFVAKISPFGTPLWARTIRSTQNPGFFGEPGPETEGVALVVSPGDLAAFPPVEPAVFVAGNAVCGDVIFDGAATQPPSGTATCPDSFFFGPSGSTVFPGGNYGNQCDQLLEVLNWDGSRSCSVPKTQRLDGTWYGRIDADGQWDWTTVDSDVATITKEITCLGADGIGGGFLGNSVCIRFEYGYRGRNPQPLTVTDLAVDESGALYVLSEAGQSVACPDPQDQQNNIDRFATVNPISPGGGCPAVPAGQVSGDLCSLVIGASYNPGQAGTNDPCTVSLLGPSCSPIPASECTQRPARTSLLRIDEGLDPQDPLSTFAPTIVPVETLNDGNPFPAGSAIKAIAAVSDGEVFSAGDLPGGSQIRINKLRENPPGTSIGQWSLDGAGVGPLGVVDLDVVRGEGNTTAVVTGSHTSGGDFGGNTFGFQGPSSDLFVAQATDQVSSASWDWATAVLAPHALTASAVDADAGTVTVVADLADGGAGSDVTFQDGTHIHTDGPSYLIAQFKGADGDLLQVEDIIVGRPVEPPDGAVVVGDQPQVFVNGLLDTTGTYHFWSPPQANPADGQGRLFFLQPAGFVEIRWPTTTSIGAIGFGEFTTSLGGVVWPELNDDPPVTIQVGTTQADQTFVSAPVEIVPAVPPSGPGALTLVRVINPRGGSSDGEVNNGVYTAAIEGYSVIHFTEGDEANTQAFPSRFEVVLTTEYDNAIYPDYAAGQSCVIGTEIGPPGVSLLEPNRPGYVLLDKSFYDGVGSDPAYSRATRTGQIVPVNRVNPAREANNGPDAFKKMAVAWYALEGPDDPGDEHYTGIYWPSVSREYDCQWPTSPDVIAIDTEQGSGELPPSEFPDLENMRIYNQPAVGLAGYNPNDEHALLAPPNQGGAGLAAFALRSDFGAPIGKPLDASDPYVLLKGFSPGEQKWKYKVYRVVATETPVSGQTPFSRGIQPVCVPEDGDCIASPIVSYYPLSSLGACGESTIDGEDRDGVPPDDPQPPLPFFRDLFDVLWPRSAGSGKIRFHYPVQSSFFYDLNSDDSSDVAPLDCVPFLARLPVAQGGTADLNTPADTAYDFAWPLAADVSELVVGETLYTPAKNGLPQIGGQNSVEVIFDELQQATLVAGTYDPTRSLVRIFDPISAHEVPFPSSQFNAIGYAIEPVEGEFKILASGDGTRRLTPSLQLRLRYDPVAQTLKFSGADGSGSDVDPLLAINVMTDSELAELRKLDDGSDGVSTDWDDAILALAARSRNPDQPALYDPATCTVNVSGPVPTVRESDCSPNGPAERTWAPADVSMIGLRDANDDGIVDPAKIVNGRGALTAGFAQDEGWVTLAFGNEPNPTGTVVTVQLIRVGCIDTPRESPYQGQVFVIEPANLFEEAVTLRHSGDFAGQADSLLFKWYYQPDSDGLPPSPPDFASGDISPWLEIASGMGLNEITLTSSSPPEQVIGDGWIFAHYEGLPACNNTGTDRAANYSLLAGQPAGSPSNELAQLNQGWVKRVIGNLNQFEARVKDFHKSPTNTYASLLTQLGRRYEGSIPLNNDPDNLNSIGLIEAYETVLRRALALSVNAGFNINSTNNAILLVSTRLAEFYTLLGSEAFSDSIDPTIGFSTEDTDIGLGTLAPTIFAFQEQLPSLLDEELTLLRGRDDATGATSSGPVYNRLFWNFTGNNGEAAYFQNYNLSDVNTTGVIDEDDARIFFPQGHGDAWGHYLTALRQHYDLLNKENFTWVPRIEAVKVGVDPVPVDYQDERSFAETALLRARAGAEIVDLTYRQNYVEDVEGQWQGYKDVDPERAWGVDGWGRRAGQAVYFDWLTANAILPAVDLERCDLNGGADRCHQGIQVIQRDNISELSEIVAQAETVQNLVDQADRGLNPLGLAKGVVPFDIDPARVDDGETHFEQIFSRATAAVENGVTVWNRANQLTRHLRRNQDNVADFQSNVIDADFELSSRLREIFGTPYPDDIGPGGTYPADFDGWDLIHYGYIDLAELFGLDLLDALGTPVLREFEVPTSPMPGGLGFFGRLEDVSCGADPFGPGCALGPTPQTSMAIRYQQASLPGFGDWLVKPPGWTGSRAVTGEIQLALQDLAQSILAFKQGVVEYNNLAADAESQLGGLIDFFNVSAQRIRVSNAERAEIERLGNTVIGLRATATALQATFDEIVRVSDMTAECIPDVIGLANDAFSAADCGVSISAYAIAMGLSAGSYGFEIGAQKAEQALGDVSIQAAIEIDVLDSRLELANQIADFEAIMRAEPVLRAELFQGSQAIIQASQVYSNALSEGWRTMQELVTFRKNSAAAIQEFRYEDFAFRIFRNESLQKYLAALELASKFTYLAATAYDYDTNLLGDNVQAGEAFLEDIVRQRNLGQIQFGVAIPGSAGLADPLGRMQQNFAVLKGQMGFNNPQLETNRFSMRREHFDIDDTGDAGDAAWLDTLREYRVDNLWDVPEFRRYARPFAPESLGEQPGLVIPFDSTVTFGLNFFGNDLGAQDSAYSTANFSTRIRAVGVWLDGYEGLPLSNTPRVYLIPVGADVLRAAEATNFEVREWQVVEQVLPIPFPIGAGDLDDPNWIPGADTLSDVFGEIRRYSDFRAYEYDEGAIEADEFNTDSRLIGRSVWNRRWLLIIPGGNLLADPKTGLDLLINGDPGATPDPVPGIQDIRLFFQTYAYSGS